MAVSIFQTAKIFFYSDIKKSFQVKFAIAVKRMVIQKKIGVKEKEAYASSFDFFCVIGFPYPRGYQTL